MQGIFMEESALGCSPGQVRRRGSWQICFVISQNSRKKALTQNPLESILKLHIMGNEGVREAETQ